MATESAGEREGGQPKQAVGSSASGSTSNGVTGGQRLLEKVLSSSATGTDLQNVARVRELNTEIFACVRKERTRH